MHPKTRNQTPRFEREEATGTARSSVRLIGFGKSLPESLDCPQTEASEIRNFGKCVPVATEIDHVAGTRVVGPAEHHLAQFGGLSLQNGRRLTVDDINFQTRQSAPGRSR